MSSSPGRTDELGSLFVAVTGADTVTEPQRSTQPDRELPADIGVDVDDGLADAVAGADVDEPGDPAS